MYALRLPLRRWAAARCGPPRPRPLPPVRRLAAFGLGGSDEPPLPVQADWDAGLALTKAGQPADAEVALQRALTGADGAGYEPRSGVGRATLAGMWRDLARAQSMQGKRHEALHNLRRALAVYDGIEQDAELLHVAEHWQQGSGLGGRLAKELPRAPDGVPPDLLLNILDNIVSHVVQLHGDAPSFLPVRLAVLGRAEAVRTFYKLDPSTTLEEKAVALFKTERVDEAIAELRRALSEAPPLPAEPERATVLRRITAGRKRSSPSSLPLSTAPL